MPVGNDVVDLRDPANQPDAIHPRFDRRVFAAVELDAMADASPPLRHVERWIRWAAKESAFKLIRQHRPDAPFHPRELVITDLDESSARVCAPLLRRELRIALDVDGERVHAVATDPEGVSGADVEVRAAAREREGGIGGPAEAAELRRCAARALEAWLGLPAGAVSIVPAGASDRRPVARTGDRPIAADVSLSHDGRWLAWAFSRRTGGAAARGL